MVSRTILQRPGLFESDIDEIQDEFRMMPGATHLFEAVLKFCEFYEGEVDPNAYPPNIKDIKLLLRAGADASVPCKDGVTPLHIAAYFGNLKVVVLLLKTRGGVDALELKGKLDLDDAPAEGQTPRDAALQKGHTEIVEYIDNKGWMKEDGEEWRAVALDRALAKGLFKSDINEIQDDEDGCTPLGKAVALFCNGPEMGMQEGNINDIKLLLRAGADASVPDRNGATPLHIAAIWGNLQVVVLLLKTRGGVDALESKLKLDPDDAPAECQTPREFALLKDYTEIVEYIDNKGWMKEDGEEWRAAAAAEKEEDEMWSKALAKGLIEGDIDEEGKNGNTALINALNDGNVEDAKLLLKARADASAKSMDGFTLLYYAAMRGNVKVVELLLKSPGGVDALEVKVEGQTPRDAALEAGHSEIVEYIDGKGWMEDKEERSAAVTAAAAAAEK